MAKQTPAVTKMSAAPARPSVKPATEQTISAQAPAASADSSDEAVNIIFRASTRFRRELKRWAVDEDTSVQALVLESLQTLRRERGLPELLD